MMPRRGQMKGYAAIIPAAGFSSRMGAFKPLLALGRSTFIDTIVAAFRQAGIDDILVVAGHRRRDVHRHLAGAGVTLIDNPDFRHGMFSSVKAGVRHLPDDCRAFFVLPVDIPLCRPLTFQLMMERFEQASPAVLYPVYRGDRGHPPLIAGEVRREILEAGVSDTLRDILDRQTASCADIEVPDRHILLDADTTEAYDRLAVLAGRRDIPRAQECAILCDVLGTPDPQTRRHCLVVARVAVHLGRALNIAAGRAGIMGPADAAGLADAADPAVAAGSDEGARKRAHSDAPLDLELICAAALLHDIAKGRKNHARAGAEWLEQIGFNRVGRIVASHTDMPVSCEDGLSEAEIMYLADKLVQGDRIVMPEDRYAQALRRHGSRPEARRRILERRRRAELSRRRLEARLGIPLSRVLQEITVSEASGSLADYTPGTGGRSSAGSGGSPVSEDGSSALTGDISAPAGRPSPEEDGRADDQPTAAGGCKKGGQP